MRKLLFTFLMMSAFFGLKAQQIFVLTPNGFVDSSNAENSFLVFDFEGKTQKEIYDLALSAITRVYNSPKDVISKAEHSTISINGIGSEKIKSGIWFYDIFYSLTLQFKDGKMRISQPNIIRIKHPNPQATVSELKIQNFFDKKGAVKNEKAKTTTEAFLNVIINSIASNMTPKQDDNW